MIHRIIYILTSIIVFSGCSGSLDFDAERFYASTAYAVPETNEITLRGIESSQQISVSSNCAWTFLADGDWLEVIGDDNSASLVITADENLTDDPRIGIIRLYNESQFISSITVTQQGAERPLVTDGSESANCYIVSQRGNYKFPALKGNSSSSVGDVSTVEVAWESFGTSVKPAVGDLISLVSYYDGEIVFSTPSEFKEGNALIAAKDAAGNILWSWHIWLTDQPQEQVYFNNAGILMDRNLGATSVTPGVHSLGLLYQWGRKDPFLGSSVIDDEVLAESTIEWPMTVRYNEAMDKLAYTCANPTTYILNYDWSYDWIYDEKSCWSTSDKEKSISDPCPAGWRVPDGGENGVWAKALGKTSGTPPYNSTKTGSDFAGILGNDSQIWYPYPGIRTSDDYEDSWKGGDLLLVGTYGKYWTASTDDLFATVFSIVRYESIDTQERYSHARGLAVRCIKY